MTNADRKYGNGKKTGKAEMSERIDIVLNLLLKGFHANEIYEYSRNEEIWRKLKKPMWLVDIKTIRAYITKANKKLDKAAEPMRGREIKKALSRYETLMSKADMLKDYRAAANIQDLICKLLGLYAPSKVDFTADIKAKMEGKLSIDDLRESYQKGKGGG